MTRICSGVGPMNAIPVARQVSATPVQALTIGYEGAARMDESHRALRIAAASGVACERVEMAAADFWRFAPRIAAAIDDPCTDPAVLPTYMLAVATRAAGAKVALCGEGADEQFAGYARYRRARLPAFLRRRKSRRGVFDRIPGAPRLAGWDAGILAVEARETAARHSRLATLLAIDNAEWLPNNLLIKLDRCLMAVGIEGRTPFLDREVIAFADSLPDRLRARFRHGKVLLRDWLAKANPAAEPYAKKRGFGVPVGAWMAPRQADLARLVARQPGIARVFTPEQVGAVFARLEEDAQPAWSLLFYALWHSHHLLGLPADGDIAAVLAEAGR
jgi:asparagine synthase (glutamine-hydrolysing)